MEHSLFSPSKSERWLNCTKSVLLEDKYEDISNPFAEEGSRLHLLIEHLFGVFLKSKMKYYEEMSNMSSNEDKELMYKCFKYLTEQFLLEKCSFLIEKKLIHAVNKDLFGTCDLIVLDENKQLHMIDYKFGRGLIKNNSKQLLTYASIFASIFKDTENVTVHIIQPKINNFVSKIYYKKDLDDHNTKMLLKIDEALSDKAVFYPSKDACKYCLHKNNCEARIEKTYALVSDFKKSISSDQMKYEILKNSSFILSFLEDLKAETLKDLEEGNSFFDFSIKEGKRKSWRPSAESFLREKLGSLAFAEKKLISITSAKKLLKEDFNACCLLDIHVTDANIKTKKLVCNS